VRRHRRKRWRIAPCLARKAPPFPQEAVADRAAPRAKGAAILFVVAVLG
jgi:hypothetical protein